MLKCITNLKLIIINLIFFSVCSHAMPAMEKVVIDNGYMHYSKEAPSPRRRFLCTCLTCCQSKSSTLSSDAFAKYTEEV